MSSQLQKARFSYKTLDDQLDINRTCWTFIDLLDKLSLVKCNYFHDLSGPLSRHEMHRFVVWRYKQDLVDMWMWSTKK